MQTFRLYRKIFPSQDTGGTYFVCDHYESS